jgi:hypothetical protein
MSTLPDLRDRFFRFELERYPVISTFLGGDGWSPDLAEAHGRQRDASPDAIAEELEFYRTVETELRTVDRGGLDAQGFHLLDLPVDPTKRLSDVRRSTPGQDCT